MQKTQIFKIKGTTTQTISFEQISKYNEPTVVNIVWNEKRLSFEGPEIWDACKEARLYFEDQGYLIGWNICGLNAVQSPMLYRSGVSIYFVSLGHQVTSSECERDSFGLERNVKLATVADQVEFKEKWFESFGNEHEKT